MSEFQDIDVSFIDRMADLHKAAFETGWSVSDFQTHIENDYDDVIGELQGEQLVGFAVIRTQEDQSEILTILVAKELRGQGIGKKLLNKVEYVASARGAEIMFLEVAADNPSAQALYSKNGYHRCGTRKGYYRREMGRVDALLLQKRL